MEIVNIGDIVYQALLITQRKGAENNSRVEQKLDRIIELLEQEKLNK